MYRKAQGIVQMPQKKVLKVFLIPLYAQENIQ